VSVSFARVILLGLLLLSAQSAHAVKLTEWNFRGGIPGRWDVKGLEPTSLDDGLHIVAPKEGELTRIPGLTHRIDDVIIHASAEVDTQAFLIWHKTGSPRTDLVQLPFVIPGEGEVLTIEFNVSPYPQWDPHTDRIGFAFPKGANVTLESIELVGLSAAERAIVAWQTFWTFDLYRPYTINFLWGPLLTFAPLAKKHMFDQLPPRARSANTIFYALLLIAAVFLIARWHLGGRTPHLKQQGASTFLLCLALVWFVFDARMGLEWFGYFRRDVETYLSKPQGERTFRERKHFYDFVEEAHSYVQDRNRYIFLAQHRWPYLGVIRYLTYPSIPTDPPQAQYNVDTWVVFDRPDVEFSNRRLVLDGAAVTRPGRMIYEFNEHSFVFRTD